MLSSKASLAVLAVFVVVDFVVLVLILVVVLVVVVVFVVLFLLTTQALQGQVAPVKVVLHLLSLPKLLPIKENKVVLHNSTVLLSERVDETVTRDGSVKHQSIREVLKLTRRPRGACWRCCWHEASL